MIFLWPLAYYLCVTIQKRLRLLRILQRHRTKTNSYARDVCRFLGTFSSHRTKYKQAILMKVIMCKLFEGNPGCEPLLNVRVKIAIHR